MQRRGEGSPTLVFESGGGNDSTVWSSVEPEIREKAGVSTILYDRAGLGKSDPKPGPYAIEDEVTTLRRLLDSSGVAGPLMLVTHSYGGFVSYLMAATDSRVVGVAFADANLPEIFDEVVVAEIMAKHEPEIAELERTNSAYARTMVKVLRAFPETARKARTVEFPRSIPAMDITVEHPTVDSQEELAAYHRAHSSFVAGSPFRTGVFAAGSTHFVIRDRPNLVIDTVVRLVKQVRSPPA